MNSLETEVNTEVPLNSKPCIGCRKRKVKCDRTRPCSNCTRSKQVCTYESSDSTEGSAKQISDESLSSDSELRERLEKLEKMMAVMMSTSQRECVTESQAGSLIRPSISPVATPSKPLHSDISSFLITSAQDAQNAPVGQILFQEGYSAYFDSDFWPCLISEIEDLRKLFDPILDAKQDSKWPSISMLGVNSPFSPISPSLAHPTLDESNVLCKLFFQNINPFVRVLHEALFGRELDQYRRGTLITPREFEALLFSIYVLTVNSLRDDTVKTIFSTSKVDLLASLRNSAQIALARVDFFKTDKIHTIQALLHYLTFLFQQNLCHDAVALLGIASRLAQTMGLHRDPSHFPYSPWVCEIRRRIWNHICCLDALALSSFGAESCLPATSDSQPPKNANDGDWHASRFAKTSSVPPNLTGFKDMTFALVHRHISKMIRCLSQIDSAKFDDREEIIRQNEAQMQEKYLKTIDRAIPSQTIIAAFVEIKISTLRLSLNHHRCTSLGSQTSAYGSDHAFAPHNWGWVFETIIPFHAIAIILTKLPHQTRQMDIDRAQRQISRNFETYSHESQPVSRTPMWKLLVELRDNMHNRSEHSPIESSTSIISGSGPQIDSDFVFSDSILGLTAVSSEQFMFDDQLMLQDPQDVPWLNSQVNF